MMIFDIKRASASDGPGLRSVVFFKGCPLRCTWCHNPESYSASPQLSFEKEKCVLCGKCFQICENGCHEIKDGTHIYSSEKCVLCGKCAEECPTKALRLYGEEISVDRVFSKLLRDKAYYVFGGGVTFSGGEPMAQFEEVLDLSKKLYDSGISVCMESCGYGPTEDFLEIAKYTDFFLFDIKCTKENHKLYTGVENDLIIQNLHALSDAGAKIILRCPIIPGVNDNTEHIEYIASLSKLSGVKEINLEPYHPIGISKRKILGIPVGYDNPEFADKTEIDKLKEQLSVRTDKDIKII